VPFQIGDVVVHLTYGIGRVTGIEDLRYQGAEVRPFYRIAIENATIWVALDPLGEARLRPMVSGGDLEHYRQVLRGLPVPLSDDRYQRSSSYNARLKEATFQTLCEVARDLSAHGWKKRLNDYDTAALRRAIGHLSREWSAVAGIPLAAAEEEIRVLLVQCHQEHTSPKALGKPA
jgi:RNA polymerase-interacting CarD/CdnL/TRCF family regulator